MKVAIIPLARPSHFSSKEAGTYKFEFEKKQTEKKKETTKIEGKEETKTVEAEITVRKKVNLKQFGRTAEEDYEHYFEAFEQFQVEMGKHEVWTNTLSKNTDVKVLFQGFDSMLTGNARTDWHDVTGGPIPTITTWEEFKKKVTQYVQTKLLPPGAYDTQVRYMRESMKPKELTMQEYFQRIRTLNRYLAYFITLDELKIINPNTTFTDWWKKGTLSDYELKTVIRDRVPGHWQNQLELQAATTGGFARMDLTTVIEIYETCERQEKAAQARQERQGTKGRRLFRGGRDYNHRSRGDFQPRMDPSRGGYRQYQQNQRNPVAYAGRGGQALQRAPNTNNNYQKRGPYQAGRYQGNKSGRFTPRQGGAPNRAPQSQTPSQTQYVQEQEEEHYYQVDELVQEEEDPQETLINEWNENLWIEADASQPQEQGHFQGEYYEEEAYYGDGDYYEDGRYHHHS